MLNFGFLEGSNGLPLSFAPLKELRSIYRFLRLFREEFVTHEKDIEFSFDFILDDHEREYIFPNSFLEFERIIRDQGRYAKTLRIIDNEDSEKLGWRCNFDLLENQIHIHTPPSMMEKIEALWRIARNSYGF